MPVAKPFVENDHGWDGWTTPGWYLDRVRAIGAIALDPCCNAAATVGANVELCGPIDPVAGCGGFTDRRPVQRTAELTGDGLADDWERISDGGLVFVNPPYGRELPKWTEKARIEAAKGASIILLVPSRTETRWMHRDVFATASAGLFHNKRIRFGNPPPTGESGPKFPSFTAYWGTRLEAFADAFHDLGHLVRFDR